MLRTIQVRGNHERSAYHNTVLAWHDVFVIGQRAYVREVVDA